MAFNFRQGVEIIDQIYLKELSVIRQIKRCRFHQIKTGLSEHLTMG